MKRYLAFALPLLMAFVMQPAMANDTATTSSGSQSPAMYWQRRGFQRLLQNPLNKSVFDIYMLPAMQANLDLSTTQVTQLNQFKEKYLRQERDLWKEISQKESTLRTAFESTTPKTNEVNSLIKEIADLRAQRQITSYDTVVHMKNVLNQDQLSRFNALKPDQLRNDAMEHLTLRDAAQMMQLMHGNMTGYGMVQWGVRQSAMMQRGMRYPYRRMANSQAQNQ